MTDSEWILNSAEALSSQHGMVGLEGCSSEEVREVAVEALVKALNDWDGRGEQRPFAYQRARFRVIDHIRTQTNGRSKKPKTPFTLQEVEEERQFGPSPSDSSSQAVVSDLYASFRAYLIEKGVYDGRVFIPQHRVLQVFKGMMEDLDNEEIGEHIGMKKASVSVYKSLIRSTLRKHPALQP